MKKKFSCPTCNGKSLEWRGDVYCTWDYEKQEFVILPETLEVPYMEVTAWCMNCEEAVDFKIEEVK